MNVHDFPDTPLYKVYADSTLYSIYVTLTGERRTLHHITFDINFNDRIYCMNYAAPVINPEPRIDFVGRCSNPRPYSTANNWANAYDNAIMTSRAAKYFGIHRNAIYGIIHDIAGRSSIERVDIENLIRIFEGRTAEARIITQSDGINTPKNILYITAASVRPE